MSRRERILQEALILAFFLLVAIVFTRPIILHPWKTTFLGYDSATHTWTLHWLVTHFFEPDKIFQGNLYYPHSHGILLTEIDLGTAILLVPWRFFLRDPVLLYNAGSILALGFGAWGFSLLVRSLSGSVWAGVGSGVLATFGSNQVRHLHHLDLITVGWIPLFLLGVHQLFTGHRWRFVFLSGTSLALVIQSNGYYGVATVIVFAVILAGFWRHLDLQALKASVLMTALALALSFPYIRGFSEVRRELHLHRGAGWSEHMAFHPTQDLGSSSYLEGSLLGRGGECLFPGLLTLALVGFALLRRAPNAGVYLAAAAVLSVIALGPLLKIGGVTFVLPDRLLTLVPPFDSMRHPMTFAEVACLLLGVVAGLGFARLAYRPWLGPLFVVLALLDTLSPPRPMTSVPDLPPIFSVLESLPPGPALEIPVFSEEILWCAARSEREFLNGQDSSFFPKDLWQLDDFFDKEWLRTPIEVVDRSNSSFLLDNYPLRYLVLPRGHVSLNGFGALSRALEKSPDFVRVAQTPDGDRIYEVRGWHPLGTPSPVSP